VKYPLLRIRSVSRRSDGRRNARRNGGPKGEKRSRSNGREMSGGDSTMIMGEKILVKPSQIQRQIIQQIA